MKTLKAEILQSSDLQWYWHLKAGNNRIVLVSETYTRKADCLRSMRMAHRMACSDWDTTPMSVALSSALMGERMARRGA